MRPFELHAAPAVTKEIKYGKKISKGNRALPTKLDHMIIVNRERDSVNFIQDEEAHKILGKEPKEIPIRLMSDDPNENFALFRGLFNDKGSLGCGSVVSENTGKALRRFPPQDTDEEWDGNPYEVECNAQCPFWKDGTCDIGGTLYFRLDPSLPDSDAFGVLRVGGTHAQRRIRASLDVLHKENWGILANLPLKVRYHTENKKASDGKTYPIPMVSIERGLDFVNALTKEMERRAALFELMHGQKHTSLKHLLITDVLGAVNARSSLLDPETTEEFDPSEVFEALPEAPDEVAELLKGMPKAKAANLLIKFSEANGDVDIDALRKHVNKDMPF